MEEAGAVQSFAPYRSSTDSPWITAFSYGSEKDEEALRASSKGVAIADRSHWARLKVSDADRIRFLHGQSTNDILKLKAGQSTMTTFCTSTARIIDLAEVFVSEEAVFLIVSPNRRDTVLKHVDKYIFFADKVKLDDLTEKTAMFTLMGPASTELLLRLGIDTRDMCGLPGAFKFFSCTLKSGDNIDCMLIRSSGLQSIEGFTLIANADRAMELWRVLVNNGARPLGALQWEQLRILDGRPAPDSELTEDYNVLEAGLWDTVSFDKGCYLGQETLAKLNTYKGVKTQLWGFRFAVGEDGVAPQPGADVYTVDGGDKVGVLTSRTFMGKDWVGLGYVRTKAADSDKGEGMTVRVGNDVTAVLFRPPFIKHQTGEPAQKFSRAL